MLTALPVWAERLQRMADRFPDQPGQGPIAAVNPNESDAPPKPQVRRIERPTSIPEDAVLVKVEPVGGSKKMNAKPGSAKAKFSQITGPEIRYDGESQACFFDCWTALNSKRGFLRKEMMIIRRKRVMTLPTANYGYSDSDEELEAADDDESQDEKEETEEYRRRKEEEERQRLEEEVKKAEEERRGKLLEHIDGCLDAASRACENSAFLWLKGQGCTGHIIFITARMMDAVKRINEEIESRKPPPPPTTPKVPERAAADNIDDDEGFDEDIDVGYASEELHHKPAGNRGRDQTPTSPRPVEMAG